MATAQQTTTSRLTQPTDNDQVESAAETAATTNQQQLDHKTATAAWNAADMQITAMHPTHAGCDGAPKTVKHPRSRLTGDSRTVIAHHQPGQAPAALKAHANGTAFRAVAMSIVEQVAHQLMQQGGLAHHEQPRLQPGVDPLPSQSQGYPKVIRSESKYLGFPALSVVWSLLLSWLSCLVLYQGLPRLGVA